MKKLILRTIIISLTSLFIIPATAQISLGGIKKQASNSLGNALENKIQQEMDKAAQKVVDKYWDRVLGKYYGGLYENESSSTSSSRSSSKASYPFMMSTDVDLEEEYSFSSSIKMKIDTYKKNGKLDETIFINTHTAEAANYIGTSIEPEGSKNSEQDFFIINDFDNEAMVMLTENDGQKMRVAFSFKIDEEALAQIADEPNDAEITDTKIPTIEEIGTKTIMSYLCKGYKMEDEEVISEVWVTQETIPGMDKATSMLGKNAAGDSQVDLPDNYPKGTMLETDVYNKTTKEKFVLQVVDINTNNKLNYLISDYPDTKELEEVEEETEE